MPDRKPTLNSTIDNLTAPPIPEVQAWAANYDNRVGPLIDLSQAVPGYAPHSLILEELGKAAASPEALGYGRIAGEVDLREAYAEHLSELYGSSIPTERTHITSGCNQAFMTAMMAVAGHGDSVLLTNPNYFNHTTTLSMLGINSTFVDCDPDNDFLPNIDDITAALTKVRAFALVSPNNPTGTIYPSGLLTKIMQACRNTRTWLIIDETYRDFMDPEQRHYLFDDPQWNDALIQLYSFSKSLCIPGHRLGAVVAGEPVIDAISKVMDNLQICAPRAAQQAVARTIGELDDWREANRKEIQKRAAAMAEVFDQLPDWHISAMGAYFAYVKHPFSKCNSVEVAKSLAEKAGISCLPGAFFGEGQDDYLRIAFANVKVETIRLLEDKLNGFEFS